MSWHGVGRRPWVTLALTLAAAALIAVVSANNRGPVYAPGRFAVVALVIAAALRWSGKAAHSSLALVVSAAILVYVAIGLNAKGDSPGRYGYQKTSFDDFSWMYLVPAVVVMVLAARNVFGVGVLIRLNHRTRGWLVLVIATLPYAYAAHLLHTANYIWTRGNAVGDRSGDRIGLVILTLAAGACLLGIGLWRWFAIPALVLTGLLVAILVSYASHDLEQYFAGQRTAMHVLIAAWFIGAGLAAHRFRARARAAASASARATSLPPAVRD